MGNAPSAVVEGLLGVVDSGGALTRGYSLNRTALSKTTYIKRV
jgi:hypothetical protein